MKLYAEKYPVMEQSIVSIVFSTKEHLERSHIFLMHRFIDDLLALKLPAESFLLYF